MDPSGTPSSGLLRRVWRALRSGPLTVDGIWILGAFAVLAVYAWAMNAWIESEKKATATTPASTSPVLSHDLAPYLLPPSSTTVPNGELPTPAMGTALASPETTTTTRARVPTGWPDEISPAAEAWTPLLTAHFPPGALNDALHVLDRESAGCATAAAYKGCQGVWDDPDNDWGCQARGLFQHCSRYWEDRVVQYGLPERCHPLEAIVDPECSTMLAAAMWEADGCSFRQDWAQTAQGTGTGCE